MGLLCNLRKTWWLLSSSGAAVSLCHRVAASLAERGPGLCNKDLPTCDSSDHTGLWVAESVCLPATYFMASVFVSRTKDTCAEIKANIAGWEDKALLVLEILHCLVFLMYLFLLICWFEFSPKYSKKKSFCFFGLHISGALTGFWGTGTR